MSERRVSRTEKAHTYLSEEILRGRWQAGDTLSTSTLAEELEMSRTPVLQALKQLEGDGLVEIIPQVGCRVIGPTIAAVEELLQVRGALEGIAAAAAARHIDDTTISELEATLSKLQAAAERGDRASFDELNARFHLTVIEASRMPYVLQSASSVWALLRHQLAGVPFPDQALRESIPERRDLFEALLRRAPRRARAAAERSQKLTTARVLGALQHEGAGSLDHSALIYGGEADFLAGAVPFVEEGLDASERVLAVTTGRNAEILGRALGRRADEVEFRDADEWYQRPSHTLLSYERYIEQADSERVRVLGEVALSDSSAVIDEWTRYESVLNVAFALQPISMLCAYDASRLPKRIIADAARTHPKLAHSATSSHSSAFVDVTPLIRELDYETLPEPTAPTAEHPITPDLRYARGFILARTRLAGVSGKALLDTFLAVQEAAANVIDHGPGRGTIRSWIEGGELIFEVRDEPWTGAEPLLGPLALDPALLSEPRGLWLSRLLCDLVEVRVDDGPVVVRLHIALH